MARKLSADPSLLKSLIRLAHKRKKLRPTLLPVIKKAWEEAPWAAGIREGHLATIEEGLSKIDGAVLGKGRKLRTGWVRYPMTTNAKRFMEWLRKNPKPPRKLVVAVTVKPDPRDYTKFEIEVSSKNTPTPSTTRSFSAPSAYGVTRQIDDALYELVQGDEWDTGYGW